MSVLGLYWCERAFSSCGEWGAQLFVAGPCLCISSLETCLFSSLAHFLIRFFIFLVLSCMCCLYILELNSLSVVSFAVIVFHSEGCLSTLLIVSFFVQKLISLPRSHLYFCFYFHYSARWVIENLAVVYVRGCYASVFL